MWMFQPIPTITITVVYVYNVYTLDVFQPFIVGIE